MLGAAGQNLGFTSTEKDGHGSVSAGAADWHCLSGHDPDDGVVDAGVDAAVVMDEGIGDALQALLGFGVIDDDGFFADVAAGHDEYGFNVPALTQDAEKEVMHRGTGKHDASGGIAGGDDFGEVDPRPAAQQHDRALAADECGALFR